MPSTPNGKGKDILDGCEDILKDFSSAGSHGQHTDRFVSIDSSKAGDSITSSPTVSPGQLSVQSARSSKKSWGRAIDKYVASVLEEKDSGSVMSGSSSSVGLGSPGATKSSRRSPHPDNHLLAALENNDNTSVHSHRSVDLDGRIDDSSFAPIYPLGGAANRSITDKNSSRKSQIKAYLKEEWKPISLIAFVILATIILSATLSGSSSGVGSENLKPENAGSFAIETPNDITTGTHPPSTAIPTDVSPTTAFLSGSPVETENNDVPTGFPTYMPTTNQPSRNPVVATKTPTLPPTGSPTVGATFAPTLKPTTSSPSQAPNPLPTTFSPTFKPTTKPTIHPTLSPINKPTGSPTVSPVMPDAYNEMKRAAIYVSGSEPFDTMSSTQSLAFHWLYHEGDPSNNLYEFFEQYAVAVVFFSLTRARTEYASQNELVEDHVFTERREVCGWEGVRCAYNYTSEMVHVTEIRLSNKGLTGTIPEEIGFLPYMNKLDLSDNEVGGTIPKELYGLHRLRHLFLNNNKIQGTISPQIDDLHGAEQIYLGQNQLTGTLPSSIGTKRPNNWRFFSVYNNQLTGPIHEGMRLRKAYTLDFSRNEFYGTIPNDIGQENYSTLRLLYLDHNTLTGTIPSSLMQMRKMKGMFLNDNRLEGMIPYIIDEEQQVNMLTIRVQNNELTQPVAPVICDMDVNRGEYELVELAVDCEICPTDCSLCMRKCY